HKLSDTLAAWGFLALTLALIMAFRPFDPAERYGQMFLLIAAGSALYNAARRVPMVLGSRAAWAAVLCSAPLVCIFMIHFGRLQFGGYDMSVLIDAGWRLYKGQRLYVDFLCTLPPAFCLGAKY